MIKSIDLICEVNVLFIYYSFILLIYCAHHVYYVHVIMFIIMNMNNVPLYFCVLANSANIFS